jgi:hypothetical protein
VARLSLCEIEESFMLKRIALAAFTTVALTAPALAGLCCP